MLKLDHRSENPAATYHPKKENMTVNDLGGLLGFYLSIMVLQFQKVGDGDQLGASHKLMLAFDVVGKKLVRDFGVLTMLPTNLKIVFVSSKNKKREGFSAG